VFLTFLKSLFQFFLEPSRKNGKIVIFKYPLNSVIFYDTQKQQKVPKTSINCTPQKNAQENELGQKTQITQKGSLWGQKTLFLALGPFWPKFTIKNTK